MHTQIVIDAHDEALRVLRDQIEEEELHADEKLHTANVKANAADHMLKCAIARLEHETEFNKTQMRHISFHTRMIDDLLEELESAKTRISALSALDADNAVRISALSALDAENAVKLEQMKIRLLESGRLNILAGENIVMRNEEGCDQDDTFYYDTPTLIEDQAGSVTKGVQKVHYIVRHLGSTVLKCSMISIADEMISVKDTAGCYTTYIHTKKPCNAAIIFKCLKAAAGVDLFRIVFIPAFGIKHLIQFRAIAMGIRHQHESLTMERTNASQTPYRQFKQYLVGV